MVSSYLNRFANASAMTWPFPTDPKNTAPKLLLYRCIDIAFGHYGETWSQKKKVWLRMNLEDKALQSLLFTWCMQGESDFAT